MHRTSPNSSNICALGSESERDAVQGHVLMHILYLFFGDCLEQWVPNFSGLCPPPPPPPDQHEIISVAASVHVNFLD